jgi:hypothetical protein
MVSLRARWRFVGRSESRGIPGGPKGGGSRTNRRIRPVPSIRQYPQTTQSSFIWYPVPVQEDRICSVRLQIICEKKIG